MTKLFSNSDISSSILAILLLLVLNAAAVTASGSLVRKNQRVPLVKTEFGHISAVNISVGNKGRYHLEFFVLDQNALFLPVLLHSNMVLYVHTGSGTLNYTDNEETKTINLRQGDIFRLEPGSVFYMQSCSEQETEKLRIHAIFSNTDDEFFDSSIGAYSAISDLVFDFSPKTLQSAFKVSKEVIQEIKNTTSPPMIVNASPKKESTEPENRLLKSILRVYRGGFDEMNKKKKDKKEKKEKEKKEKEKEGKMFNIFDAEKDFQNCNGWVTAVDQKDLRVLRGSNVGVFMVNLTKGSMMAPHWNRIANEIAVVVQGEGMVRVVCSSRTKESGCQNKRFWVKEGDVFAVPRFHPMVQTSFNNGSLVFMGFSSAPKKNYLQFLAGKGSVVRGLDKEILGSSLNVRKTTVERVLSWEEDEVIVDCTSCAEEEVSILEKETEEEERRKEKEKEEEERKKEKEEEEEAEERRKEKEKEEEAEERRKEKEKEEEAEEHRKEEEKRRKEKEKEEEAESRKEKEEEEESRKEKEEEAESRKEKEEEEEKSRKESGEEEEEEEERGRREEEKRREKEKKEQEARERETEEEAEGRKESGEEEEEESGRREEKRREKEKKEREAHEREKEEEPKIEERERRQREEAASWEQETARRQEEDRQKRARKEEEADPEDPEEGEEETEPTIKPYVKGFGYKDRKF